MRKHKQFHFNKKLKLIQSDYLRTAFIIVLLARNASKKNEDKTIC